MKTAAKLAIGVLLTGASIVSMFKFKHMQDMPVYAQKEQVYLNELKKVREYDNQIIDLNQYLNKEKSSIDSLVQNLPEMTYNELVILIAKQQKRNENEKNGNYFYVLSYIAFAFSTYSAAKNYRKLRDESQKDETNN
jgi:hypothetical protein